VLHVLKIHKRYLLCFIIMYELQIHNPIIIFKCVWNTNVTQVMKFVIYFICLTSSLLTLKLIEISQLFLKCIIYLLKSTCLWPNGPPGGVGPSHFEALRSHSNTPHSAGFLQRMCKITNSMHCLFLVYWIKIPLHVSGINSPSSGVKVYICVKWYF
jgi:hypothetical protein